MPKGKYMIKDGADKYGIAYRLHRFRVGRTYINLEDANQSQLKRLFEAGNKLIEKVNESASSKNGNSQPGQGSGNA